VCECVCVRARVCVCVSGVGGFSPLPFKLNFDIRHQRSVGLGHEVQHLVPKHVGIETDVAEAASC
jgi:hypothetical protein